MSELIARIVSQHVLMQRPPDCPVIVWLQAQASRLEGLEGAAMEAMEDQVRLELTRHEGWLPQWSVEGVLVSAQYDEPRRSQVQAIYATDIAEASDPALGRKLACGLIRARPDALTESTRAILDAVADG